MLGSCSLHGILCLSAVHIWGIEIFQRNDGDIKKLGPMALGHMPLLFLLPPPAKVFLCTDVIGSAWDGQCVAIQSYLEVRR